MRHGLPLLACFVLFACDERARPERALDASTPDATSSAHESSGCVQAEPALELSASPAEPVAAGTPVSYSLTVDNQDSAGCEPSVFSGSVSPSLAGLPFTVTPDSLSTPPLAAGERFTASFVVQSRAEEEAGEYRLGFFVRAPAAGGGARSAKAEALYRVREPAGCHVSPARELLIRHPSVVDDARATSGVWSFGELMRRSAPREEDAPHNVEHMLQSFTTDQTVNGLTVAARPNMQRVLLDAWPRTEHGELDLTRAPLRLLAIVHRLDLQEGRFVYGVLGRDGAAMLFTLILEYQLPGSPEDWAHSVHALQTEVFPSDAYNAALEQLTERFTARGAAPGRPNGSALLRVRSNENALGQDGRWEMRELRASAKTGLLEPAPLALTPDASWNGSARLASFIEDNRVRVLAETHDVPAQLDGRPFQAGSVINVLGFWRASGLEDAEARREFSLNTCDGCHGGETFTSFFQVFPRAEGEQSALSAFLTGVSLREPITGEQRAYNELDRRRRLLEAVVCTEHGD